jgi:GTP-binding protein HflX
LSLHEINDNKAKRAFLVSIQLPGVTELENRLSLDELARLVTTLGHEVVGRTSQKRSGTGSRTVLGQGKLEEMARLTEGPGITALGHKPESLPKGHLRNRVEAQNSDEESEIEEFEEEENFEVAEDNPEDAVEGTGGARPDALIFDCELTPSQLRNLEKVCGCEVLDRTGVIIEIFSRHARTRAARLQVEIARLTYLAPRIRETGGGADRGGGGVGAKGAGETSIELDRRKIRDRIKELRTEFASIDKEQDTRRSRRNEIRTVALVGYTNAGKSSLMRAMTGSEVLVADKLFATLDTTIRPMEPPSRPPVLISDTVGFIKKLPHDLVASFKSTLDEALNAALLLFVVDSSDPSFRSQLEVTKSVLGEVGVGDEIPSLLILNKHDRLNGEEVLALSREFPEAIQISTRDKADVARLRETILQYFEDGMIDEEILIPYTVQGIIGEIRSRIRVLDEVFEAEGVRMKLRAKREEIDRLRARYGV